MIGSGTGPWSLAALRWRLRRGAHALSWHLGVGGWIALVAIPAAVGALEVRERAKARLDAAQRLPSQAPDAAPARSAEQEGRARLARFESALPTHEEIAWVLQSMDDKARREKLRLTRGDYSATEDGPGGFLRYRMSLPVSGDPLAVHRFIVGVLEQHRALALQSVQFRREPPDAPQIDARVQWTLFARPPGAAVSAASRDARTASSSVAPR